MARGVPARARGSRLSRNTSIKLRGLILLQEIGLSIGSGQWPYWSKYWRDFDWNGLIKPAIDAGLAQGANCFQVAGDGVPDFLGPYPDDATYRSRIEFVCRYIASKGAVVLYQLGFQPKYSFGLDGSAFNSGVASAVKVAGWVNQIPNVIAIDVMNEWNYSQPTNWSNSASGTALTQITAYITAIRAVTSMPMTCSVGGSGNRLLSMTSDYQKNIATLIDFMSLRGYFINDTRIPSLASVAEMKAQSWYRGSYIVGELGVVTPTVYNTNVQYSPADLTMYLDGFGDLARQDPDCMGCLWWGSNDSLQVLYDTTQNYGGPVRLGMFDRLTWAPRPEITGPFSRWPVTVPVVSALVAPTVTSASSSSVAENAAYAFALTSDQPVTWSLVGGADQAKFALAGANLSMVAKDYEAPDDSNSDRIYLVTVRATNGSTGLFTDQVRSVSLTNVNDTNPSAFSFTAVAGYASASVVTSNAITIAGLGASDSVSAAVSGAASSLLSKNGAAFVAGPVTVVNGDTLAVRHTTSASDSTATSTTLSAGTTVSTFTSTTAASTASRDVLVSYGQSNSIPARNGGASELPAGYYSTDSNVFIWDSPEDNSRASSIIAMVPGPLESQPLGVDSAYPNSIGWKGEFTKHYRIDNPSAALYHFTHSCGGSRFSDTSTTYGRAANWDAALSDGRYSKMKAEWAKFVAALAAQGIKPNVTMAFTDLGYSSGRADGNESGSAAESNAYEAKMTSLISAMRTDIIGNAKLVIARCNLSVSAQAGFVRVTQIRTAQKNIVTADPTRCELMNTDGMQMNSAVDVLHFTAAAHAVQGEMLYYHYAGLWYPQKDIAEMGATIYPVMEVRPGDFRNTWSGSDKTGTTSSVWDCLLGGTVSTAPFVQATAAKRPVLTATALSSGYPARFATFDGTDDIMTRASLLVAQPSFSIFGAASAPAQGSGVIKVLCAETSTTNITPCNLPLRSGGSGNLDFIQRNDAGTVAFAPSLAGAFNGTMNFFAANDDRASMSDQVNGTASAANAYTRGATTVNILTLGACSQNAVEQWWMNAKVGIVWATNIAADAAYTAKARIYTQRRYGTA